MKRSKKYTALYILIALLFIGLIFYFISRRNNIKAVKIENETNQSFEAIGIVNEKNIILSKADDNNYLIDNSLFKSPDTFCILAVDSDNNVYQSGEINLKENDKISIEAIEDNQLIISKTDNKSMEKIAVPDISNWKLSKDSSHIMATFSSDTNYDYTLYVVGKDGKLGISDTSNSSNEVMANWESGKYLSSLVKFDLKKPWKTFSAWYNIVKN